MQTNFFVKSHGLGNDYIVLDSELLSFELTEKAIKRICDIHYGIGSDGILLKVPSKKADFGIRIFNPDASEAEKSGNGLRIFCKYLFDNGFVKKKTFTVETISDIVTAEIIETQADKAKRIKVDMGKAEFIANKIPVVIDKQECIGHEIEIIDTKFQINCLSVGNPHCVIFNANATMDVAKKYGPIIEKHPLFPKKINVQFVEVISKNELKIEIWERGAGYTLASGSSSCAVACMSHKLGLTTNDVTVIMPGGKIQVSINENWEIKMVGDVREIASGFLSPELLQDCL